MKDTMNNQPDRVIEIVGMKEAIAEIERRNAPAARPANVSHANGMAASNAVISEIRESLDCDSAELRLQKRLRELNQPRSMTRDEIGCRETENEIAKGEREYRRQVLGE